MRSKITLFLLSLIGMTACSTTCPPFNEPDYPAMYGVPTAQFTIKGRVTDATGTPIKGIRVNATEMWFKHTPNDNYIPDNELEREPLYPNPTHTSESGEYEISSSSFGWRDFNVTLSIEDIDGAENGGEFAPQTANVHITSDDKIDQGTWTTSFKKQADDIVVEKKN